MHPEDGLGWYGLGFAYMRNSQSEKAEEALRKAIALGGTNAVWHRDLGAVLAARGAVEEARREYDLALQLNPANPTPYINIGNLERRAGDLEQALANYRKAEAVDSSLSIALHAQTQVLQELKRDDEAAAVFLRWVAVRPNEHATRLQAARFLHQIGRSGEAVDLALEGVRRAPGSGEAATVLGLALYAVGDIEGALRWMLKAESLHKSPPERAQVRTMLGRMKQEAPDSLRGLFPPDSMLGIRR
jgi:Flp pilus assembly protein TadD